MDESMNRSWEQDGGRNSAELDRLLAAYRMASPAPEAGADFMPRLWEKIDGRQSWTQQAWKWANGMVAAAVAASLFFAMLQALPERSPDFYGATYLETLANQHDADDTLDNVALVSVKAIPEQPAK